MGEGKAYAVTAPLITKADGSKFGKSESGNVWIDKKRTSVYTFYQYWINSADEDASRYIRIFTLKTRGELEAIEEQHAENPGLRYLQKELAKDVTLRIHNQEDLEMAISASGILFGKSSRAELAGIPAEELLSVFDGVPQAEVSASRLASGLNVLDLLTDVSGFLPSKGEARRALKENSISVNKEKVGDAFVVDASTVLHDSLILLQRGKKNYFLIRVV
jgi:tyrosyl-tRNA synthetase